MDDLVKMYDSLLEYQISVVDPILQNPFCSACGDPIERTKWTGRLWKCERCKKDLQNFKSRERKRKNPKACLCSFEEKEGAVGKFTKMRFVKNPNCKIHNKKVTSTSP